MHWKRGKPAEFHLSAVARSETDESKRKLWRYHLTVIKGFTRLIICFDRPLILQCTALEFQVRNENEEESEK